MASAGCPGLSGPGVGIGEEAVDMVTPQSRISQDSNAVLSARLPRAGPKPNISVDMAPNKPSSRLNCRSVRAVCNEA